MRTINKAAKAVVILLGLLMVTGGAAAVPYQGYIYNSRNEAIHAPQAYLPAAAIDGEALGVGPFKEPRDLAVGAGMVYLADTGNNRVVGFDLDGSTVKIIDQFQANGRDDRLRAPTGVFVTSAGELYVADRDNGRIVHFDAEGHYVREIGAPSLTTETADAGFRYKPTRVAVDPLGRIYVIADGVYDGIMEFDKDGVFRGYVGAPRVKPTLSEIFWRRFATEEQRQAMALFLPVEYVNIDADPDGFVFAVEAGDAHETSIKKLVPGGRDVLVRNGYAPPVGDVVGEPSRFVDVKARENGIYSVLDRTRGRVFTYDSNGYLLYVFGALGEAFGAFKLPAALEVVGDEILVLDLGTNSITRFEPTPYTRLIHAAIDHYEHGDMEASVQIWEQILRLNINMDFAYLSVGRSYLTEAKYAEAMAYFKLGNSRDLYSKAFAYYRKEVVEQNFGVFALAVVLIVLAVNRITARMAKTAGKRERVKSALALRLERITGPLKYAFHVVFHPFDGFWDLKHEQRGTASAATIILTLVVAAYIFMRQYTGYLFNARDPAKMNVYMDISSVVVPFLLWCLVNWALTTLMDGKGTLKEIYIASAYALTPIVLINVPMTIVSNYLTLNEDSFYYLILAASVIWSAFLLFSGTMVLHEYDVAKTLLTSILIVVGIGSILFLGLIFLDVINLLLGFVTTIYAELVFRT